MCCVARRVLQPAVAPTELTVDFQTAENAQGSSIKTDSNQNSWLLSAMITCIALELYCSKDSSAGMWYRATCGWGPSQCELACVIPRDNAVSFERPPMEESHKVHSELCIWSLQEISYSLSYKDIAQSQSNQPSNIVIQLLGTICRSVQYIRGPLFVGPFIVESH